jgi:hypothetical protein
MAIPSGSGTEVLKRVFDDETGTGETTLITGVANHIYTILSVIVCSRMTGSETFSLYIDYNAGGTDLYLLDVTPITAKGTFVFSDKFILTGTDKLHCTGSATGYDVWCTYIDQDWT